MGRPRGKGKKSAEASNNDDGGSSAGEEAAPTAHKRTGSPQKPHEDDKAYKVEDNTKVEEVADGVKPTVPAKGPKSRTAESNGEIKRPQRRRRRRQVERGSSESVEGGDDVRTKPSGFRRNGSRRKNSTPRRAAEAGVECDQPI